MSKRIFCFALSALLCALSFPAQAQQPKKVPRIGVFVGTLAASSDSARIEAFRQGLRELGYVEGQNIAIEYRYAEGRTDRLSELAAELVHLKVDVIITPGTQSTEAAQKATHTIPIVMTQVGDPVAVGIVASLARPGGNITGLTQMSPGLSGKRLELLKEGFPKVTRVAFLYHPANRSDLLSMKEVQTAARGLGLTIQSCEVRSPDDFDKVFSAMAKERADAFMTIRNAVNDANAKRILDLAEKNRLPAIYDGREYVEIGGLMSYGVNLSDSWRRAATYVDKILKGAKPADLPVEQPTKFELVINLKTAKQIGLTIPQSVLYRADKVIR